MNAWDFKIEGILDAGKCIRAGKMQKDGYPINTYTLSGSWQAKAWRLGFDQRRNSFYGIK